MPSIDDIAITLRRFDGVNQLVDSATLGPTYLRAAANWIPGETFRLTKAPGTTAYAGGNIPDCARVPALLRVYAQDGSHRYLYAVRVPSGSATTTTASASTTIIKVTSTTGYHVGYAVRIGTLGTAVILTIDSATQFTLTSALTGIPAGGEAVTILDDLWVSTDDAAWAHVAFTAGGNAYFQSTGQSYGMEGMNGVLYVGNGHANSSVPDPIIAVAFGGTAGVLAPVATFTDGSAAPTVTADTGSQILTGSYAYCWAIFDHTAGVWLERGQTRTVTNAATGDQALSFPVPTGFASNGGALSTRYRGHLMVAPINLPVEFAHDQTPAGITAGATVLRVLTADGLPLPVGSSVVRTGRYFRWHKGRLWISGDETNPTAVWATSPLVPGLEQTIFNAGLFFPINARVPRTPTPVTGLGSAMTTEDADPRSPLAYYTLSRTFLFYGDILDDPGAADLQASSQAGCISHETSVETPWGLFVCGLRSVYLIPLGGGAPVDVGWPIRPSIQAIPPAGRPRCTARYHRGFYKLAIVPPGGTTATIQWWLDLRRGLGQIPSWWGPHRRVAVSAWTVADADPAESDRLIHAVEGTGTIELAHQLNSYSENAGASPIISSLTTGELDNGRPFDRKVWTRARATGFPGADTALSVNLSLDGGTTAPFDAMDFAGGSPGSQWRTGVWRTATWGTSDTFKVEGESVFGDALGMGERPFGVAAQLTLTHSAAVAFSLRDIEVRHLPIPRPTRASSSDPSS